jgi:hypothetical protein
MGTEVKDQERHAEREPVQGRDATKPWKRQFFECRDIGPEPSVNGAGFWRRPVHGIPVKVKER